MRTVRVGLLSAALLISGGCFLQKKPTVTAPVPAPPAPVASPAVTPPPPVAAQQPSPVPAQPAPTVPTAPPTESAKPSPFPPATTRPAAPIPAKPAPALGAILTADKRKQLNTAYQADLKQANLVLGTLSGKKLTTEQQDSVSRARAFIRQAAQYHDHDLTTAAELAHRARVLTQDLAGALK